jgi:isopentenyldiphosphate isomerase
MKADLIIVDSDDQPIATKSRDTLSCEDIYRVSALWILNSKDEVLLAQRKWSKKNDPGKWGPAVAGTVEVGETYESNIYKEAEEEIGLRGIRFTESTKLFFDDGTCKFFCQWYVAKIDKDASEFVLQEEEVEQIAWIPRDQLIRELDENASKFLDSMRQWRGLFL